MVLKRAATHKVRNAEIYRAVIDGGTFGEVAGKYGISRTRVQQIYGRERANAWVARSRGESSYLDRPFPSGV